MWLDANDKPTDRKRWKFLSEVEITWAPTTRSSPNSMTGTSSTRMGGKASVPDFNVILPLLRAA